MKVKRRRELLRLAATRGSIETGRFQRLNKLKSVAEHFQGLDMDEKRFVAERLCNVSLSQEGGASALVQQEILPLAGDQDSIPSLQQPLQEPPPQVLLAKESPLQEPPSQELPPKEPPPKESPPKEPLVEPPSQELPPQVPLPKEPPLQEPPPPPVYPISPLDVPVCIEQFFP